MQGCVICLCEELLEYTLKNHQVSQEPKGILHAFNIALVREEPPVIFYFMFSV
jgi:hypothetical protein